MWLSVPQNFGLYRGFKGKKEQTILSSNNERRTQTQSISSTTLLSYQSNSYECKLNFQRGLAIWHKSISSSLICLMMSPVPPLLLASTKKCLTPYIQKRTPSWKVHPHSSPFLPWAHCAKQVYVVICKCFTLPKVNNIKNEYQFYWDID